ncbi:MAG: hypothetical protein R3C03_08755 [Pirellulaceae bacterium]
MHFVNIQGPAEKRKAAGHEEKRGNIKHFRFGGIPERAFGPRLALTPFRTKRVMLARSPPTGEPA